MRFEINGRDFRQAVSEISACVSPKANDRRFAAIRLTTDDTGVSIVGIREGLSAIVRLHVAAKVLDSGSFSVPGYVLSGILKGIATEVVTVSSWPTNDPRRLQVEFGREIYRIVLSPTLDDPGAPNATGDSSLNGKSFREVIDGTAYATGSDTQDPVYQSIFIRDDGTAYAGDRSQFVRKSGKAAVKDGHVQVPSYGITLVKSFLGKRPIVKASLSGRYLVLVSDRDSLQIDVKAAGAYPADNIDHIFTQIGAPTTTVNRLALLEATERVLAITDGDTVSVCQLKGSAEQGLFSVSASSAARGDAEEIIAASHEVDLVARVNTDRLREFLRHSSCDDIRIACHPLAIGLSSDSAQAMITQVRG